MKRIRLSLGMLGSTLLISAALLLLPSVRMSSLPTETPAKVRLAQVEIGDVEQVLAFTGRIGYESEYAVLAPAAGVIRHVYVSAGDRVREGQALFRMDASAQEAAISSLLSSSLPGMTGTLRDASALLESLTVRAPAEGRVHQVAVSVHGGVAAATPSVLLSTGGQRIICRAVMTDAVQVRPGMQARILMDGEMLCEAVVDTTGIPETDTATGQTISQLSLVPGEEIPLPLGAAVEAEIILHAQQNVPVLPVETLNEDGEVWWVADGRCYRTDAGVIMADELLAWVSLPEGEQVVLAGEVVEGQRVRDGVRQ